MSDLESRLAEGLTSVGRRGPHPGDLAAGARQRLRRRRRTRSTVVAASLAVVALAVGMTMLGGGSDRSDRREPSAAVSVPDGWRAESWRDLTLRVPPEWERGGGTDWCTGGRSVSRTARQVSRPAGVVPAIACAPSFGYGAHFLPPSGGELPPGTEGAVQQYRGERYPDGAWIGYATTGEAALWVVTESRQLTRQVLDSTEPTGEVDDNGCPGRSGPLTSSSGARVSVCRYSADGWLEQSELLSPEDSAAAVAAIATAPRQVGTGSRACGDGRSGGPVVALTGREVTVHVRWHGRCRGVDDGVGERGHRQLTEGVLYWALSPGWSGSASDDVPLPSRLRAQ